MKADVDLKEIGFSVKKQRTQGFLRPLVWNDEMNNKILPGSLASKTKRPRRLCDVASHAASGGPIDPALRNFLDSFYLERDEMERQKMIADRPSLLPNERANAYLAATAEHLAQKNGLKNPAWASEKSRFLSGPFFPCNLESLKASMIVESPSAFRRRLIFVGSDPLYRPRRDANGIEGNSPAIIRKEVSENHILLTKSDMLCRLQSIDSSARTEGVTIDFSIYGDATLTLVFDMRSATRDVDAVVRGSPDLLRKFARQIAKNEGWDEDWLNDGVKGFTSGNEQLDPFDQFSGSPEGGLRIYTPAPEYLFAMKCMAMRPEGVDGSHDISDIEGLAKIAGINSSEQALKLIESFYPANRIPPKVRFGVEEIMERMQESSGMTHKSVPDSLAAIANNIKRMGLNNSSDKIDKHAELPLHGARPAAPGRQKY